MKLKELDKHYKTEAKLDQFTKAQNLITSAIFSGWKIDFEVNSNEDYDADNRDDHPSLISTYVWAPSRWDEDHIEDLHLLTYTYPQAIIELATQLKDVIEDYNCPYCSMLNDHGKEWAVSDKSVCIVRAGTSYADIVNYEDYTRSEYAKKVAITHCPFCGKKLVKYAK